MSAKEHSKTVLPIFGTDTAALVKRWAEHPMMGRAKSDEERRKVASYLEWQREEACYWSKVYDSEEADEAQLRKTLTGRILLKLADLLVYPIAFIEWLFRL